MSDHLSGLKRGMAMAAMVGVESHYQMINASEGSLEMIRLVRAELREFDEIAAALRALAERWERDAQDGKMIPRGRAAQHLRKILAGEEVADVE